jgi:hypothetical protein
VERLYRPLTTSEVVNGQKSYEALLQAVEELFAFSALPSSEKPIIPTSIRPPTTRNPATSSEASSQIIHESPSQAVIASQTAVDTASALLSGATAHPTRNPAVKKIAIRIIVSLHLCRNRCREPLASAILGGGCQQVTSKGTTPRRSAPRAPGRVRCPYRLCT